MRRVLILLTLALLLLPLVASAQQPAKKMTLASLAGI